MTQWKSTERNKRRWKGGLRLCRMTDVCSRSLSPSTFLIKSELSAPVVYCSLPGCTHRLHTAAPCRSHPIVRSLASLPLPFPLSPAHEALSHVTPALGLGESITRRSLSSIRTTPSKRSASEQTDGNTWALWVPLFTLRSAIPSGSVVDGVGKASSPEGNEGATPFRLFAPRLA